MSVYFIACGGFIKVGFSDDPVRRAERLFRSGSRYSAPRAAYEARGDQVLLGFIEGSKTTEYWLHQAIDDYAAGCEWFIDEPGLRTYLSALTDNHEDQFSSLRRPGGPIWDSLPFGERGGSNAELGMQVLMKQRNTNVRPVARKAAS